MSDVKILFSGVNKIFNFILFYINRPHISKIKSLESILYQTMSDKSLYASTAVKAGTDARLQPPSPAKTRVRQAMLDVRYVLLLIDPDLIEEEIVGKQVNHVTQLITLYIEEDSLLGITEANKRFIRRFRRWYKWKRNQQSNNKQPIGWQWR